MSDIDEVKLKRKRSHYDVILPSNEPVCDVNVMSSFEFT